MHQNPIPHPDPRLRPIATTGEGRTFLRRLTRLAAAGLLLLGPPALAVADLVVERAGGAAGAFEVVLTAPGGDARTYADDDGDGTLLITPAGGAGVYRLEVRSGGGGDGREIEVPDSGLVTVVYRPEGAADRLTVTYGRGFGNEEIVVTARRREESLQTTPVSITVFSGEEIVERSVEKLSGVGDFSPNVDFSVTGGFTGAPSEATVFIRGIGQLGVSIFADPGVGIYLDGVYLARAQGSVLDLLDLERVEVLRGPQGTLFGKNTIGGAISLVTRKPSSDFDADLELTTGSLARRELRGRVNGSLGESVSGSFAVLGTGRDGFAKSLTTGRTLDGEDRLVARGALRWLPSDRMVVDISADASRERVDGLDQPLVALSDQPLFVDFYNRVVGAAGFPVYSRDFITDDLFESYSSSPVFHDGDVGSLIVNVDRQVGDGSFTSITSLRSLAFDSNGDRDGSPIVFVEAMEDQEQRQISQELQLSGLALDDRLTWLVGALVFREDANEKSTILTFENLFEALEAAPGPIFSPIGVPPELCNPGPPPPGLPCFGGAGNPLNGIFGNGFVDDIDPRSTSTAVFGHGTFNVTERLSANLGLRYTHERKELSIERVLRLDGARQSLAADDAWDALSPKLGLDLRLTPRALLYGSLSWGFKSGGFNGIAQDRPVLDSFDPEEVLAYELGLKTDWFDNRLRLNGAAFYNAYTDIQFVAGLVQGSNVVFVIQNAGQALSKGIELELAAEPSRLFRLTGSVGYLDTHYTELIGVDPSSVPSEGVFPKSPDWTVSLSPQLFVDLGDTGDLVARVDYSYRGRVYHDISNTPSASQAPLDLVNARVSWTPGSERFELSLFGTNLTDEAYTEHGYFVQGFGPTLAIPGRPREWGVSARLRFGSSVHGGRTRG